MLGGGEGSVGGGEGEGSVGGGHQGKGEPRDGARFVVLSGQNQLATLSFYMTSGHL